MCNIKKKMVTYWEEDGYLLGRRWLPIDLKKPYKQSILDHYNQVRNQVKKSST